MSKQKAKVILREAVPFLTLLALIIFFAVTTGGTFLSAYNIKTLFIQSSLYIIGGVGATFVMAHGNLDFSLGGELAIAAVFGCMVGSYNSAMVLPVCIVIGILCSFIVGTVHMYARIPCFIVGFSMMFAGRGIASAMVDRIVVVTPASLNSLNTLGFYAVATVITVVIGYIIFEYTRVGKNNKAIGSNPKAAELSGIPIKKYKYMAFIITGITIGLTAFVSLIRAGGFTGKTGANFETQVLLALVLGGISLTGGSSVRIRSIVIGAILYMMLDNGLLLMGVEASWIDLIRGVIFLFTVYVSYDKKAVGFVS